MGADGLTLKKLQYYHFFMEAKKHISYSKKSLLCHLFIHSKKDQWRLLTSNQVLLKTF